MIINPSQLESMQVYPDIGLMPNDRYDREEEKMLCGYCHEAMIDADQECCEDCRVVLNDLR